MQRAIFVGLSVSFVCAVLSCFLVLKGWALMGDAISHAVLPGIVVASLVGVPLVIGAFVSGLSCALLTGYIKDHSRLKEDAVLGVVFAGIFALGLVMFTKVETDQHLMHVLFGNMLGITGSAMWQSLAISFVTSIIVLLKYKEYMLYCFDHVHAQVSGLNVKFLQYSLLVMLSLTIVAAMQVVGAIMVIAMLVGPGIIGLVVTKRFSYMLTIAISASCLSTLMGAVTSYHLDASTSACIILCQALIFIVALSYKTLQNAWVTRYAKVA
ncbi:metal ABC transporter permease [Reinekea thalattae]|uniref:Metal ABC transporter permease n=2 Tax=Reinekea thalattae TaxID=2593301 RepID=A0A5C8ZAM9_9GAMM|nr:metal ABC transporter permease [Reinekea thalattae]